MFKLLALFCVAAAVHGRSLETVDDSFYGNYHLIYVWPELKEHRPNCTPVIYTKPDFQTPATCKCKNEVTSLSAMNVEVLGHKFDVTADIITNVDQLRSTINEDCSCSPAAKSRDVIVRINEDFILHYVDVDKMIFLLGKVVPSDDEIKSLISSTNLGNEGSLFCHSTLSE